MPTKLPTTEPHVPQAAAVVPLAYGLPNRSSSFRPSAALSFRRLLAVAAIYWLYVTVSDILYANSLRVGFGEVTTLQLFLPWDARLFQHLLLFPALIGCLWLSLRQGWQPLWRAVPLQVLLATCFAVAAAPALWVGQWLFAKVTDNHPDLIWGSFTDQTTAQTGVNATTNPADGPFAITKGNLNVQ